MDDYKPGPVMIFIAWLVIMVLSGGLAGAFFLAGMTSQFAIGMFVGLAINYTFVILHHARKVREGES